MVLFGLLRRSHKGFFCLLRRLFWEHGFNGLHRFSRIAIVTLTVMLTMPFLSEL
jgi:hypothetical protein